MSSVVLSSYESLLFPENSINEDLKCVWVGAGVGGSVAGSGSGVSPAAGASLEQRNTQSRRQIC